jgi:hypothetical protein
LREITDEHSPLSDFEAKELPELAMLPSSLSAIIATEGPNQQVVTRQEASSIFRIQVEGPL